MQLVFTPGDSREKVRNPEAYQRWLSTLQPDDEVLLQAFEPATKDFPVERWKFSQARIANDRLVIGKDNTAYPFDLKNGWTVYCNSEDPSGTIFPRRIVPRCHDLTSDDPRRSVCGHLPVYEPYFLYRERVVYLLEEGRDFHQRRSVAKLLFKFVYEMDVDNGTLFHGFCPALQEQEDWQFWMDNVDIPMDNGTTGHAKVRYLYSQTAGL